METLKVLEYLEHPGVWVVQDSNGGKKRWMDIYVSGCLPGPKEDMDIIEYFKSLVGRTITVEYTHPFIELAEGVTLISNAK